MASRYSRMRDATFEDFVPEYELVSNADADILRIYLPGFTKEQCKVKVSSSGILRISGERDKGGNIWVRFNQEFPISENCDKDKIKAKYERGILIVTLPKLSPKIFEDIVPKSELYSETDADIIQIYLPDFSIGQFSLEITTLGNLRVSGQRQTRGDIVVRFQKEFSVPANCNLNKMSENYEAGILYVRQPKLVILAGKKDKLPAKPVHSQPEKPAANEQRKTGEDPSKKTEEQEIGVVTAEAAVPESEPSQPQKP